MVPIGGKAPANLDLVVRVVEVAKYHYALKSKLGVSSDIDLIYYCMRHGLVASATVSTFIWP